MKNAKKTTTIIFAIIILLILGNGSFVVTQENDYKLIRQFGKIQKIIETPGLSVKIPFIQTVDTVPKEILLYDLPVSDVITSDKKSMMIDSYVLWKVSEPKKFAQTLSGSTANAEARINTIIYNAIKNTISNMTQDEVIKSRDGKITVTLSEAEEDLKSNDIKLEDTEETVDIKSLTEEIMANISASYDNYGIDILTVEVKKLDLPDDNKSAVYSRMISERENIAAQYGAEGKSEAKVIQNTTDKEVSIMKSTAEAEAEKIIAEGEAQYMQILSEAYNDEAKGEFYGYVRSLDAARESLQGNNKTLILSKDSPIAQIFYNR